MDIVQVVILGAIQGLTEFIPISSSAHLVIVRWLFGWDTQDLVLDVSLHLGTLFALVAFFWREWYDMIASYLRTTRFTRKTVGVGDKSPQVPGILIWPIILACIPAGLAGVLLEEQAATVFRSPYVLAATLIGLGLLLLLGERLGSKTRPMHSVRIRDWLLIGLAQALAIVPGVSRSGITITAGLLCGLEREAAARFSFLLGAPVILGAALFEMRHLLDRQLAGGELLSLGIGILTATIVGYLCIGFLLRYLRRQSVGLFVAYRVILGLGIAVSYVLGFIRT